jgi:hypothetical protein
MEYKVLSGPFNAGKLESDLDGHPPGLRLSNSRL